EDAAAELHETARARDDAAENPVAVFLPDFKFSAAEIDRAASTGERRDGEIEIVEVERAAIHFIGAGGERIGTARAERTARNDGAAGIGVLAIHDGGAGKMKHFASA